MTKINLVIPTYNESQDLHSLIRGIEESLKQPHNIIFVDDNSPDGTADLARKLNENYGNIKVLQRPGKLGIGSAIVDGLEIALKEDDCEIIVTMDGDLSHNPKEIPHLLSVAENQVDLVQGSRYMDGGEVLGWNRTRYFMSVLANWVCKYFLNTGMNENTTYFRAYSRKLAEILIRDIPKLGFEFAIGSILLAKDNNLIITEVPITFTERSHGKSKLRFKDVYRWWRYVMITFFKRGILHVFKVKR